MSAKRTAWMVGLALSLLAIAIARAQPKDKGAGEGAGLTEAEIQVLARLHHANQMEIEMGKLGASQARSAEVKSYAARLVKDHTRADAKVMDLAQKRGLTVPQPMPKNEAEKKQMDQDMALMTRLKELEGEAFDREYIGMMVTAHNRALLMVAEALPVAADPQLVALLKSVRPVLQQHHKIAAGLAGKMSKPPPGKEPSKPQPGKEPSKPQPGKEPSKPQPAPPSK
jgi:putative membrane protein